MVDKNIKDSLDRYIEDRIPTGSFLRAVLENDLMEAVGRADLTNRNNLHAICLYVYNNLPRGSWGSVEAVEKHLQK